MEAFIDSNGDTHVTFTPEEVAKINRADGELSYRFGLDLKFKIAYAAEKARETDLHMDGTFTEAEKDRFLYLRDMERRTIQVIKEARAIYGEREMGVMPSLSDFKRYIENLDEPLNLES